MTLQKSCPHCGASYKLSDQQLNKKLRCGKCREWFIVGFPAEPMTVLPVDEEEEPVRPKPQPTRTAPKPRQAIRSNEEDESLSRKGPRSKSPPPSNPTPWLLLIGGACALLFILAGIGGTVVWLLVNRSAPVVVEKTFFEKESEDNALVENNVAPERSSAKGIEELKAATVFIKVAAGPLRVTGTGFVIKTEGNAGFVVTNDHVVHPDHPGVAKDSEISVVFKSGTRQEHIAHAELIAADPEKDLAVLKVNGVANLPRPIDISGNANLSETLPVTVFGFPFGESLSSTKGNPSITVSKGSVSSIRRDKNDEIVAVQIDGALNPGNSGGPVVDSDGHLVGVAVATIRGANIGMAVPGNQLTKDLAGRVIDALAISESGSNGSVDINVKVLVFDPMDRIHALEVNLLRSDLLKDPGTPDKEGHWPNIIGAQRLALKRDGLFATGRFVVLDADKDRAFTYQTCEIDEAGKRTYSEPRPLKVQALALQTANLPANLNRPDIRRPRMPRQVIQPPRLGATDQPPTVHLKPINPLPNITFKPHVPKDEKEEVALLAPVADIAVGGGGRYLIAHLPTKKRLAVFDVQQGRIVKEIHLAEEVIHFAANATRLAIVYPNAKQIQFWNLSNLQREKSALLPDHLTTDTIHQICMGSASPSAGPLFVYLPKEKRTLYLNLDTLAVNEVQWTNWAPNNAYGPLNMRASPDGCKLIGWGGGWAGLDVALFNEGKQIAFYGKLEFWAADGVFALPSADGQFIYTPGPWGIVNANFKAAKLPELKDAYLVPAMEPGIFLSVPGACAPGSGVIRTQPAGEVSFYSEDRKKLFILQGVDELKNPSSLPWEKRVIYYPKGNLLVTLGSPLTKFDRVDRNDRTERLDRLVLRRVNVTEHLNKSGVDYLAVISRPSLAKAGALFSYKVEILSKKGGVKVKLDSGPADMKVTPEGVVTWQVPPKAPEPAPEVVLTITDSSEQEIFHSFRVEVGD